MRAKKTSKKDKFVIKPIHESDVIEKADFGSFVITKTKSEIIFSTYTGYYVIVKPYVTHPLGKHGGHSLFTWLSSVIDLKKEIAGKEKEKIEGVDNVDITNEDWLDTVKIVTEANITKPCVVFTDLNYAMNDANKHIEWLKTMSNKLQEAMLEENLQEDNEELNEEEFSRAKDAENLANLIEDETNI